MAPHNPRPREPWRELVWTHRWGDELLDTDAPKGRFTASFDWELLVELVEPRLPGGAALLIWFRERAADLAGEVSVWEPMRVAMQSADTTEAGLPPLADESARGLREVPLTYLIDRARLYVNEAIPGQQAVDAIARLNRAIERHKKGTRHTTRISTLALEECLPNALRQAEATAPASPTQYLASRVNVDPATVRRWRTRLQTSPQPRRRRERGTE